VRSESFGLFTDFTSVSSTSIDLFPPFLLTLLTFPFEAIVAGSFASPVVFGSRKSIEMMTMNWKRER
jgi:hypothetical protein